MRTALKDYTFTVQLVLSYLKAVSEDVKDEVTVTDSAFMGFVSLNVALKAADKHLEEDYPGVLGMILAGFVL